MNTKEEKEPLGSHVCRNGKVRPYPEMLCSMCPPGHKYEEKEPSQHAEENHVVDKSLAEFARANYSVKEPSQRAREMATAMVESTYLEKTRHPLINAIATALEAQQGEIEQVRHWQRSFMRWKDVEALIKERDQLKQRLADKEQQLEQAVRLLTEAPRMAGHNHWDDTMQHGAGCYLCITQRALVGQIREWLTSPAIAPIRERVKGEHP